MHRLSLRSNRLKFETSGGLPIILRGIYRIYLKGIKQNRSANMKPAGFKITEDLDRLCPKILPGHCAGVCVTNDTASMSTVLEYLVLVPLWSTLSPEDSHRYRETFLDCSAIFGAAIYLNFSTPSPERQFSKSPSSLLARA